MKVTVVGAHGKVAMHLHPILRKKGHEVRGIIRNPDQKEDLRELEVEPVVCDIEKEDDISDAVGEADAVVFAAGAGPGSGAERKFTVDRDGAIKLIDAAKENGIDRYILISAMGLDESRGNEVFQAYQKAKKEADEALRDSGLGYTIIKPGGLTNEEGKGQVALLPDLPRANIPREDVAGVLADVLETPELAGYQFDLTTGNETIQEAVVKAVQRFAE